MVYWKWLLHGPLAPWYVKANCRWSFCLALGRSFRSWVTGSHLADSYLSQHEEVCFTLERYCYEVVYFSSSFQEWSSLTYYMVSWRFRAPSPLCGGCQITRSSTMAISLLEPTGLWASLCVFARQLRSWPPVFESRERKCKSAWCSSQNWCVGHVSCMTWSQPFYNTSDPYIPSSSNIECICRMQCTWKWTAPSRDCFRTSFLRRVVGV